MDSLTQIDGLPLAMAELNKYAGIVGWGAGEPGAEMGVDGVGLILSEARREIDRERSFRARRRRVLRVK